MQSLINIYNRDSLAHPSVPVPQLSITTVYILGIKLDEEQRDILFSIFNLGVSYVASIRLIN